METVRQELELLGDVATAKDAKMIPKYQGGSVPSPSPNPARTRLAKKPGRHSFQDSGPGGQGWI